MMTPQEVANCTFAKSVMGGYNMASVDDFLDKLTEDYSALFKENAALKGKLKKTVDEVNKYRESEGTICSTLLAAQKSATAIVAEAEQRRDRMIEEASREAKARLAELEKVSGLPVPTSLAALKDAPCRFPAVCRAGEMGEKVLEFLG